MPIHDWTLAPAGIFHHFHQAWSLDIVHALNRNLSSQGYYAFVEQRADGPEGDVITVDVSPRIASPTATIEPPKTKVISRTSSEAASYARKANRINIHHPFGNIVAVIEIVSPGNKNSRHALRSFVDKALELLSKGVHLLIVDLFPPSKRDPQGIHQAIWEQLSDDMFTLPQDKPLTLAAYQAGIEVTAYVEPVGVGDVLPDMPLFLGPEFHTLVPLEATYRSTFELCPEPLRRLVGDIS